MQDPRDYSGGAVHHGRSDEHVWREFYNHNLPDDGKCPVDPGSVFFAAATVLSVVATSLQIGSCVLLLAPPPKGSTTPLATGQQELAAGQQELAAGQPEPQRDAEEVVADDDPPPPSAPSLSDRVGAKLCRRGQPTPMDFYKISESHSSALSSSC